MLGTNAIAYDLFLSLKLALSHTLPLRNICTATGAISLS